MSQPEFDPTLLARLPDDPDSVIAVLREAGASVVQTAHVLVRYRGLDLAEAKERVHGSPAWADLRETHDRLHDQLSESLS